MIMIAENDGGVSAIPNQPARPIAPIIEKTIITKVVNVPLSPLTQKYNTTINTAKNKFGPQSKNLASIIRGFKSAVTIYARKNNLEFDWQPRYYDHIIRNQIEFDRIKRYINRNPANW